ncbi:hypothetical protein B1J93_03400 [Leptospira kirschneri serovar Pomona]|uniref:Uncharacterized protein n=1 Tax=Leptospira kirschneri serovar Pomona TaxID=561005 RepID=A0A1T1E0W8_9LEPT|nr:hypothetical protein AYB32_17635 [Leptospira kirschneri]KXZ28345.1 hypothetical protein AYB34_17445 [Leptospira sp. ZV016]OOV46700.1 hypothetical protein B1J93_03400 [Leptospira kirschneri serovar Pomona]
MGRSTGRVGNSAKCFPETQRLASTVARQGRVGNSAQRFPKGRVVGSSYWYFMKIESDSKVSQ